MNQKKLICIGCPKGCNLTVFIDGGKVSAVDGNECKKGSIYGKEEVTNPKRMVTSTIRVKNGTQKMLPVKTASGIPKEKVFACMQVIKKIEKAAPVNIGDVIMKNIANTGVDLIAAQTVALEFDRRR